MSNAGILEALLDEQVLYDFLMAQFTYFPRDS